MLLILAFKDLGFYIAHTSSLALLFANSDAVEKATGKGTK